MHMSSGYIDFDLINTVSQHCAPDLLWRWSPDGQMKGRTFIARNPRRAARNPKSVKLDLCIGLWADFATGDGSRDPIARAGHLFGLSCPEAARKLAVALGLSDGGAAHG